MEEEEAEEEEEEEEQEKEEEEEEEEDDGEEEEEDEDGEEEEEEDKRKRMSKRKRKRMAKRQMSRSRKGNGKRGKGCGSIFAVVLRPRKSRRVRGAGKSAHPSSRTRVENSRPRPPPRTNPWGTYLYKPALVLPLERRGRPWGATIDLSEVLGSSMSAANRASGPPCSIEQVRDQVGGLDPAFL